MKPLHIKTALLAAILLCCIPAAAEDYIKTEYSSRRYTTQDGLPNMLCLSLFQDSKGFLWAGTFSGFVRYDGFTFKGFHTQKSDCIRKIFEDENGIVTAIGGNCIYKVLPNDSTLKIETPGLHFNIYTSLMLPPSYFVCSDANSPGIYRVTDSCAVKLFDHPALINDDNDTNAPYLDVADSLFYISDMKAGTYAISPSGREMQHYETPNLKAFYRFGSKLYAFGDTGIYVKDDSKFRLIHPYMFVPTIKVIEKNDKMIIKDVWGIYTFDGSEWEVLHKPSSKYLHFDFLFDNEDNLWCGTELGLLNLFRLQFKSYKLKSESDRIVAMVEDNRQQIWMGTWLGDLFKMKGDAISKINLKQYTPYNNTYSGGAVNMNGKLYLPFNQAIQEIDHENIGMMKGWIYDDEKTYLPGGLHVVGGDTLIAYNVWGNLFAIKDYKIVKFWSASALKQNRIRNFEIDKKGQWLVSGATGLSIVRGDSGIVVKNELLKNIHATTRDGYGTIWIGAENRICTWNGDTVKLIDELGERRINCMKCVGQHFLVVATINGIFLYDLRDFYAGKGFKAYYYDRFNGYIGLNPLRDGIFEDSGGRVWIMSNSEVTCFRPEELIRANSVPQLNILSQQVSRDNIRWATPPEKELLKLGYRNKNIRFSFIGLSFSATQNVRYQYRLLGFQDGWTEDQSSREAVFNNLPPGRYEFQLKANSGVPGTETPVVSQVFTILPAFWQTWWFYAGCFVLLVMAVGYLVYRYVTKKNVEKIKSLERQKQLTSLQIQSIRLRSIPHFNANVLAGIEYYIMNFSKEEANHYLAMYSSFTNLTLRDVDRPARSLAQEIRYTELYLGLEKMRFGKRFDFSIDVAPNVDTEIMLPNMILHTHCENALKHGLRAKKGTGHLHIEVSPLLENEVLVVVEDDGIGREEAKRQKTEGTGQGLYILSQQIELYNQSNPAKIEQRFVDLKDEHLHAIGTRVEIMVPKGFQYN